MKQIIKIVRKVEDPTQYEEMLKSELDYELANLYDAMQNGDEAKKEKSKQRLSKIHAELGLGS